jgi:hypothetical protein
MKVNATTNTNTTISCSSSSSSRNKTFVRKSLQKQEQISVFMGATFKIHQQKA